MVSGLVDPGHEARDGPRGDVARGRGARSQAATLGRGVVPPEEDRVARDEGVLREVRAERGQLAVSKASRVAREAVLPEPHRSHPELERDGERHEEHGDARAPAASATSPSAGVDSPEDRSRP